MQRPGTNQDLYVLERKLLDAIDREYQRYLDLENQPISPTLVKMMVEAHDVISRRLAKSGGRGEQTLTPQGLRALAVDLAQELAEVQQMIQQGEMLS